MLQDTKQFYEIDLKQGDLSIRLISDDSCFISKQMERWFELLLDDSYRPIAIPPGSVSLPAQNEEKEAEVTVSKEPIPSPPELPSPSTRDVSDSLASEREQQLVEQIHQLQLQVQAMEQQVLSIQQQPEPATEKESSPLPASEQSAPALPKEPSEVDLFAKPAHADFMSLSDGEQPQETEQQESEPTFEQPVDNSLFSVDNSPAESSFPIAETPSDPCIEEQSPCFQQPVENPDPSLLLPEEMDSVEPIPPEETNNDFDLLMESLLSDLEAPVRKSTEQIAAPVATEEPAGKLDPFEENLSEIFEQEAFSEENHYEKADLVDKALFDKSTEEPMKEELPREHFSQGEEGVFSSFSISDEGDLPKPEPLEPGSPPEFHDEAAETQLETEIEKSMVAHEENALQESEEDVAPLPQAEKSEEVFQELPAPAEAIAEPLETIADKYQTRENEQPKSENSFEQELHDLFAPTQTKAKAPNVAAEDFPDSILFNPDIPEYDPPEVNYDFGIPPPSFPDDPHIRKLSLESLQIQETSIAHYESPFPPLEDEEADEEKASAVKTIQKPVAHTQQHPKMEENVEYYRSLEEELQIETLLELCELAPKATTSQDFMLLSAYFLSNYKQMGKYSLKDMNAQLVRSGLTPVNHGVLERAISNGYLELEPDLTGTAHAAEYMLTPEGQAYSKSLIKL